jgi:N-acetylglucosaminyldiphosphoundecaprenol N-acetyl-beta-D-mannosaminyltransferase
MSEPAPGPDLPAPVNVAGSPVHPVPLAETLAFIEACVGGGRRAAIYNVNAHAVTLAARDERLRRILWSAPLVFCDGKAVQWAARLLGGGVPERYTPPDWIDRLSALCEREGWGLYLLGAEPGVGAAAAGVLRGRYPRLEVFEHHGYFDHEGPENDLVVRAINQSGARVLLVGFGMPLQEYWMDANLPRLEVNVALSVGALIDYLAGRVYRAPRWITDAGLEWLARLVVEPRRLWRRYLIGNSRFLYLVLRQRLGRR